MNDPKIFGASKPGVLDYDMTTLFDMLFPEKPVSIFDTNKSIIGVLDGLYYSGHVWDQNEEWCFNEIERQIELNNTEIKTRDLVIADLEETYANLGKLFDELSETAQEIVIERDLFKATLKRLRNGGDISTQELDFIIGE